MSSSLVGDFNTKVDLDELNNIGEIDDGKNEDEEKEEK